MVLLHQSRLQCQRSPVAARQVGWQTAKLLSHLDGTKTAAGCTSDAEDAAAAAEAAVPEAGVWAEWVRGYMQKVQRLPADPVDLHTCACNMPFTDWTRISVCMEFEKCLGIYARCTRAVFLSAMAKQPNSSCEQHERQACNCGKASCPHPSGANDPSGRPQLLSICYDEPCLAIREPTG